MSMCDSSSSSCTAGLKSWGNGELGIGHIPGSRPSLWRRSVITVAQGSDCHPYCTWTGTPGQRSRFMNVKINTVIWPCLAAITWFLFFFLPVVWESGDNEMVEPTLAEWGLCHLHVILRSGPCWPHLWSSKHPTLLHISACGKIQRAAVHCVANESVRQDINRSSLSMRYSVHCIFLI